MKTLAKITLLAVGFAVAALPAITAAADTAPAPGDKPGLAGKHPRLKALLQRKAVRQRIAQRLGLTAEQITQLKATRARTVEAIKSIRADASLTTEQKKANARATVQAARGEMRGVLTPDQQARMGKLRALIRGRMQTRGAL